MQSQPSAKKQPTKALLRRDAGLLRLISANPSELNYFYDFMWTHKKSALTSLIETQLFGRNDFEFLQTSNNPVPRYDDLGKFPLYIDQKGREYYDASTFSALEYQTLEDFIGTMKNGRISLFVRIPRKITAQQPLHATNESVIDFPEPNKEVLVLTSMSGSIRFPFSMFITNELGEEQLQQQQQQKENDKVRPDKRLSAKINENSHVLTARVHSVEFQRRATALITIRNIEPYEALESYAWLCADLQNEKRKAMDLLMSYLSEHSTSENEILLTQLINRYLNMKKKKIN